jgi:hypothetical protein
MALPKLDTPIYELKLPSNEKIVRFRPFLVKEEKLFLMAAESNDVKSIVETIKQVIRNCVLDDIDIDSMPIYDIEYLFLNLRARSISEVVELNYKCLNEIIDENGDVKECTGKVKFNLNLLEINPEKNPKHTNKIQITDKLGVVMKYPSFEMLNEFSQDIDSEKIIEVIINCIDYLYDDETLYYAKNETKEELLKFVESLPTDAFAKIQEFFETMPKLKKKLDFKCPKCSHEESIVVEGVQSFFE